MPHTLVSYSGWKNCLRLFNSEIELIATLDVGPRIIRFGFIGGQNEFAEYPEQTALADDGSYHSYGGHRLLAGPEVQGWIKHPDNDPVDLKQEDNESILTAVIEQSAKLQKQLRIRLNAKQNHVCIIHTITNHSNIKLILAPWALSVMAPGGRAIIPHEPFIPHPECVWPARPLVLWSYTEMQDPRWTWGSRFVQLKQDTAAITVQKCGTLITKGWAAYINNDHVFIKYFPYDPKTTYPDFGCNAEIFTNHRMLEVESLGPLTTLNPDESVKHKEDWYLFRNINIGQTDEEIEESLLPLIQQTDIK